MEDSVKSTQWAAYSCNPY